MRYWRYFRYVLRHKVWVYVEGCRLGIPRWRLLVHDWDKFLPWMFAAYTNHFYDTRPKDPAEAHAAQLAFDRAWQAHWKRNKHHWEHWAGAHVPEKHALEIAADWLAMGHNGKPALQWYEENKERIVLHDDSRRFIETLMLLVDSKEWA